MNAPKLSIAALLDLMEVQTPEAIHLNHVVIENGEWTPPPMVSLEQIPSFTVSFAGFVEVEIYMDATHRHVAHLCVRQSAMTFVELGENGDVLPNLTVDCRILNSVERKRLDKVAARFMAAGQMSDKSRGEELLHRYVEKAMFDSRKFGGMANV